jgi:threonine aldolase
VRATIDLRSDTFTLPTESMYDALPGAPLGDDVYGEDPTVRRLEALAAARTGKEAALLVTSGTQGNLVSLLTHCARGAEVILGASTDLYNYEVSGMSVVGGLMPRPVDDSLGYPAPEAVSAAIRDGEDVHVGPTGVVCVENTHQRAGGLPIPLERLAEIGALAREHGLPVHMDGARVFNAAVALGVDAFEIVRHVDSVTFCLSKGLSGPAGSIVSGPEPFIARARRMRKLLGGGMRQSGWIAAAGIVALEEGVDRLAEDHLNARRLADGLARVPGIELDPEAVKTNIVYLRLAPAAPAAVAFVAALEAEGVKAFAMGERLVRLVTHRNIEPSDVDRAVDAAARALERAHAEAPAARLGPYAR